MLLGPVFDRFCEHSPISVMIRGCLEHALVPDDLDALFRRHAQEQYTRELLFSSVVDLMGLVVTGVRKSVHAAYQASPEQIGVSLTSVYNKLQGIEPRLCAELVRYAACRLGPVLLELGGTTPEPVPGYRLRVLDGNHLPATEHRLRETRADAAAPLPGQALVVFEPALGLVTDVFPCEDGHAQERALLGDVLARVQRRDLWLGDRNFCVRQFLLSVAAKGGFFVIREHANLGWEHAGKVSGRGRIEGARVREQRVALRDDEGRPIYLRRVVLTLEQPTRDGDTEIALLTNLPAEAADARAVGRLYRKRWTIEGAFQDVAVALHSEIDTLCYPRAALFAFCVALVAYDVLAVVKGAVRAAHGAEAAEELSAYYLADEIAGTQRGMMIAIPAEHWRVFRVLTPEQLADVLLRLAGQVRLERFRRHRRGPKKPPVKRRYSKKRPHVSTAKLLENRYREKRA
jgi:IS4 transposase